MAEVPDRETVLDTERRLLQVVCQGTAEGTLRYAAASILRTYAWREPMHRVVFEVLMGIATTSAPLIREHFPARLARRGFPDFESGFLFEPHGLSKRDAEALMRELAALPAETRSTPRDGEPPVGV